MDSSPEHRQPITSNDNHDTVPVCATWTVPHVQDADPLEQEGGGIVPLIGKS